MDPREIALFSCVFHLPAEISITSVDPSPTELVIGAACQTPCTGFQGQLTGGM